MMFHTLVCLVGIALPGAGQAIDDFNYPNSNAAQEAWIGHAERGKSSAVSVVMDDGRKVLEIPAPFGAQPKLGRVYIDRKVKLNLAAAGEFKLEIVSSAPEAAGRISLYFRSGSGWYSAGGGLTSRDWQSMRFSKAAFSIEGQPAGWHQIDGIRIGVWRGQSMDYVVRLRLLEACQNDVALVIPSAETGSETKSALKTAEDVGEMLAELGLGSDAVDDAALASGALGKRRVAILAYNPQLPKEAVDALVQYVEQGGKLLICYQLPSQLGTALGFADPKYHSRQSPGQFSEIRFDADDITGLPESMHQASWNITTARPANFNARVIAHWFNDKGQPTDQPAMLLSDRGAFFSHIILRDDRAKKKQMLAALLGKLSPDLWKTMAESQLESVEHIGHLDRLEELEPFVDKSGNPKATQHLAAGRKSLAQAKEEFSSANYSHVGDLARTARDELCTAYLLAQPSLKSEGRAFWNHSGTGAYDGDWDRTAKELTEAGFNVVLPNMLWGGRAHYASDVLPRSATFRKYGDQIEQCVAAAKKYGIEVHVWKVNFNLSGAPKDFVQKIHREHRNQVSVDGKAHDWLCPSNPANQELELASMLEVAKKYDVDGLHFDYIRYPGRDKCYCDGCRARFQEDTNCTVENWPEDCYSGPHREAYTQWRCDQITRLVKAVHDQAKALYPEIIISAAVFGAYPGCRESVAQDWPEWIKAGYLDFVCPMDYTQGDMNFIGLVKNQLKLVEGRIPVYPGIGQWRLSDDRTVGQIFHARKLGAAGFTIFNLSRESAESAVPAIGMGVGQQKALPPHRKRINRGVR